MSGASEDGGASVGSDHAQRSQAEASTRDIRASLARVERIAGMARLAKDRPDVFDKIVGAYESQGVEPALVAEYRRVIGEKIAVYTELERTALSLRTRFKIIPASELSSLAPPTWLIQGIVTDGGFVVLSGHEATGKSFLAIDFALAVANGTAWQEHPVRQGAALYVAAEGKGGLVRRIAAWLSMNGGTDANLYILPDAPQMRSSSDAAAIVTAARHLTNLRLIVIDTLARTFVGGDENAPKDMGEFVANCALLSRSTGAAVLVIHHLPKGGGQPRGHSSLSGAADTLVKLEREGRTDSIVLKCDKQKEAEEFKDIALRLAKVRLASGDESLVVMASAEAKSARGLNRDEQRALDVLTRQFPSGAGYSQWKRASGLTDGTFDRASKSLVMKGHVQHAGPRSKYQPVVVPVLPPPTIGP